MDYEIANFNREACRNRGISPDQFSDFEWELGRVYAFCERFFSAIVLRLHATDLAGETFQVMDYSRDLSRRGKYDSEIMVKLQIAQYRDHVFGNWKTIACRDASFSLYHFHCRIQKFNEQFKNLKFDRSSLKLSRSLLLEICDDYVSLRHHLAHLAERSALQDANTTGLSTELVHSESGSTVYITESLVGDKYQVMREGKFLSIDVSFDAVKKIQKSFECLVAGYGFRAERDITKNSNWIVNISL